MIRRFACALALGLVALSAAPADAKRAKPINRAVEAAVAVSDSWIRLAPPGAEAMAGYMVIMNPAKRPLVLYGATSPHFQEVQLHVVRKDGDQVAMEEVDQMPIPGHGQLLFKPGNSHLMLMGPRRTLKAGDKVPLVLDFGPAGHRSLLVKVVAADGGH